MNRLAPKLALCLLLFSVAAPAQWITASYYSGWNFPPSSLPWGLYTHVSHFYAAVNPNGTIDMWGLTPSSANAFTSAAHAAGKKALVAIADQNSAGNSNFASATKSATINTFVNNIVNFVNTYGYDGVEFDWEQNIVGSQYADLVNRLKAAKPNIIITADVGLGTEVKNAMNLGQASIDQVNVMCYDMDGTSYTWFNDALLQGASYVADTCDSHVYPYVNAGVKPSKMGIGIPFYARRWTGATGPQQSNSGKSTMNYNSLVRDGSRWQAQYQKYDSARKANYLSIPGLNGGEFIAYAGTQQIQDTVAWAKSKGYGGYFAYAPDQEYLSGQSGYAAFPLSYALYTAAFGGTPTAPNITTTSPLQSGTYGAPYSQTLSASGSQPITWSLSSGILPSGLNLSASGTISGTPTSSGTNTFTVLARNSAGSKTAQLSLTIILPSTPPTITMASPLKSGIVGKAYSAGLTASGSTPMTWAVTSGALPAGLTLSSTNGIISGTPTKAATNQFTVTATNSGGNHSKAFTLATIYDPFVYWKLDNTSGTAATDSSGNGKSVNLFNTPSWLSGSNCRMGGCLSFNGSNEFGSVGLDLSDTAAVTMSFWLKWPAYANDDSLAMEFGPNFNNSATGFMVNPDSSNGGGGKFEVALKGNGGYNQILFARPSAGVWHHYAVILNKTAPAANEVIAYVDGVAVPYTKPMNVENTNNFASSTLVLMSRNGSALFGYGVMDDVRIYKRVLSGQEIQALASGQ